MPPIIAIVGYSESGKTTLIEKLLPELISRGYKVATVKHTHHRIDSDDTEKDSRRHLQAGSSAAVLCSPRSLVLAKPTTRETTLDEIARLLGEEYDLIVAEGFKRDDSVLKIEMHLKDAGGLLTGISNRLAIVTDEPLDVNVKQFSFDDTAGLASLVEEQVIISEKVRAVLYADGVKVSIKSFIQEMVANAVEGIAASLKGVGKAKSLELFIRRKRAG